MGRLNSLHCFCTYGCVCQRFVEQGSQHVDAAPGDIVFIIDELRHSTYTREGHNLRRSASVTLQQALVGFSMQFPHLDGHTVTLNTQAPIQPGQDIVLPGKGMPVQGSSGNYGDMIVTVHVQFPTRLSKQQRLLVEQLFRE